MTRCPRARRLLEPIPPPSHAPDVLTPGEKRRLTSLRTNLSRWASEHGRDFRWRADEATAYERVVVEVLLQRTTATAVARFFDQFIERFPTWEALAEATVEELELFLKPLGLWRRRASSLLGLASYAVSVSGQFPSDAEEHRDIPAVGQYVSNAILLFQHAQAAPLLDVNMARVLERYIRPRRLADIRFDPWLQRAATWYARGAQPSKANWAILDFAATVCKARLPECYRCPVMKRCNYPVKTRPRLTGKA